MRRSEMVTTTANSRGADESPESKQRPGKKKIQSKGIKDTSQTNEAKVQRRVGRSDDLAPAILGTVEALLPRVRVMEGCAGAERY